MLLTCDRSIGCEGKYLGQWTDVEVKMDRKVIRKQSFELQGLSSESGVEAMMYRIRRYLITQAHTADLPWCESQAE